MQTNLVYFNFKSNDINYNTIHDRKSTFKNIKFQGQGDEFVKTDSIKNYTNGVNKEIKQLQLVM